MRTSKKENYSNKCIVEDELFLMYKRVPLNFYDLLKKVQFLTILGGLHDAGRPVVNQKGLFTYMSNAFGTRNSKRRREDLT